MTQRKRDYCFTINNPDEKDLEEIAILSQSDRIKYLIVGREKGEKGTPHIQGYVYFSNAVTLAGVSKLLRRAHITPCAGNPDQNRNYCMKDGDYDEFGVLPISQKRKGELEKERWDDIRDNAKKGRFDEIPSDILIRHYRTLRALEKDYADMPPDADGTTGEWYWGSTGTGKSRKAREENPGAYLKMCNKWWDSYTGQDVVILEDFDKSHAVLGHHLKIWADRYAFPAEIKGGKINIRPRRIIITSNYHPQDIWSAEPNTLDPILRRFNVTHFSNFPPQ